MKTAMNTEAGEVRAILEAAGGAGGAKSTVPGRDAGGGQTPGAGEAKSLSVDELYEEIDGLSAEDRETLMAKLDDGGGEKEEEEASSEEKKEEDEAASEEKKEDEEAASEGKKEKDGEASSIAAYREIIGDSIPEDRAASLILRAVESKMPHGKFMREAISLAKSLGTAPAGGGAGGGGGGGQPPKAPSAKEAASKAGVVAGGQPLGGGRTGESAATGGEGSASSAISAYEAEIERVRKEKKISKPQAVSIVAQERPDLVHGYRVAQGLIAE